MDKLNEKILKLVHDDGLYHETKYALIAVDAAMRLSCTGGKH